MVADMAAKKIMLWEDFFALYADDANWFASMRMWCASADTSASPTLIVIVFGFGIKVVLCGSVVISVKSIGCDTVWFQHKRSRQQEKHLGTEQYSVCSTVFSVKRNQSNLHRCTMIHGCTKLFLTRDFVLLHHNAAYLRARGGKVCSISIWSTEEGLGPTHKNHLSVSPYIAFKHLSLHIIHYHGTYLTWLKTEIYSNQHPLAQYFLSFLPIPECL